MERFADAAAIIKRNIAHSPEALPAHFYRAACYGQLGEKSLARDALAEVRCISPDFSLARAPAIAAYRREADLDRLIEGLRRAGLRECQGSA
jgi:hypothetical protein